MGNETGYAVVHAYHIGDRTVDYAFASSPYHDDCLDPLFESSIEAAETQLAHCQAMQADGIRGTDGEYFIVRWERTTKEDR